MVRILVLTNMYPPHHYGGLELSCADVVDGLRSRGHDVEVLTSTIEVDGRRSASDATEGVRRELRLYWDDHRLLDPPIRERIAIERSNQRSLRRALEEFRPDIVAAWGMGAMSLGLLATVISRDVPVVFCVCDDWLVYGMRLDAWSRLFVRRPMLSRAVTLTTGLPTRVPELHQAGAFCWVSDRTRRFAEQRTGVRFPRSTTVYSGVDLQTFGFDAETSRTEWQGKLLYVGRIDPRKGVETAIRALTHLPGASLAVVGRGDPVEMTRLESLAAALHVRDRVSFTVSDRSGLPGIYAGADALLFTSVWDEPFGLVPLEAMACGTPVIATGVGGSAEFLIDDVNCLLFPAGDDLALAKTIERLGRDTGLRSQIVQRGLDTAGQLSVTSLVDTFEEWYVAAADRFRTGTPASRPPPLASARVYGDDGP